MRVSKLKSGYQINDDDYTILVLFCYSLKKKKKEWVTCELNNCQAATLYPQSTQTRHTEEFLGRKVTVITQRVNH